MKVKSDQYIYTFLGVGLSIFIIGFIGITFSLKFIENNYVNIQLDVNKRQAQSMAKLLENELNMGLHADTVRSRFQKTIEGTEFDKGFLCMFSTEDATLACHPNKEMIGMAMPQSFTFDLSTQKNVSVPDHIIKGDAISGLFYQGDMGTDIVHMEPVNGTPWLIAAHTNYELIREEFSLIKRNYIIGSAILGFLLALAATVTSRRISRIYEDRIEKKNQLLADSYIKLEKLNDDLINQKEEIESQNNLLVSQKDIIIKQKEDILASIEYAKRIQDALLSFDKPLEGIIPEHFLLFRPKDIVSGDFYWVREKNDSIYIVVGDCTGHGVPGAFMSVLGITLLNEVIELQGYIEPDQILNELRARLKKALNQVDWELNNSDGIEMSLLRYEPSKKTVSIAASYHTVLVCSNDEVVEIKGDRCPIGVCFVDEKKFNPHTVDVSNTTIFYMFSDGFPDQIGGTNNKKFQTRRLKQLIKDISKNDMDTQKRILEETLDQHIGNNKQTDDIILMGVRL